LTGEFWRGKPYGKFAQAVTRFPWLIPVIVGPGTVYLAELRDVLLDEVTIEGKRVEDSLSKLVFSG
jgi:hypothetical protein